MNILIVEDEPPIAEEIKDLCESILGSRVNKIDMRHSMEEALQYLSAKSIDLCLLDLNLRGSSGYEILKTAVAGSFHTIVISAHTDQAVEAFNYGILDFVPKPIIRERLETALNKYAGAHDSLVNAMRFVVVRKKKAYFLYSVEDVIYFKAQGYLVRMYLKSGKSELIEKPLSRLMHLLPKRFIRAHRSCVVDVNHVASYRHKGGGVHEATMKNGDVVPLSRAAYKILGGLGVK